MTSEEFLQQMAKLAAGFRKTLNEATAEVYYEALGNIAPADLAASVAWAIKTTRFLPTPAELLERARYERTTRLKALPAAASAPEPQALPEWVTEEADVRKLVDDLQVTLTSALRRVESIPPPTQARPGEPPQLSQDERMAKATAMLKAHRDWMAAGEPATKSS